MRRGSSAPKEVLTTPGWSALAVTGGAGLRPGSHALSATLGSDLGRVVMASSVCRGVALVSADGSLKKCLLPCYGY